MRIKPFVALRPTSEAAPSVAELPYDVVKTEEAASRAAGNPRSYFHISRSEIDLPAGTNPYSPAVYEKAASNLAEFQKNGTIIREKKEYLYVYRLQMGRHVQHGIAGCFHIEDYERNIIKKHEKTRADKEEDRARHLRTLNANTGPVLMFHRDDKDVSAIVMEVERGNPLFDFTAPDGVKHTVWQISGTERLVRAFDAIKDAYIADGHHRCASAVKVGCEKRAANRAHRGDEEYNWFMGVIFPAGQLNVLAYNRVVKDLNGMSPAAFLDAVRGKGFEVRESKQDTPAAPGRAAMFLAGKWHEIAWPPRLAEGKPHKLDVTVLQEQVLGPILGIDDPRTSKRIEFVGGVKGAEELARLVASGERAVAFSMHPVSVNDVMAYSDAGLIMPPKSTWFEPKLRSGLFIHTL